MLFAFGTRNFSCDRIDSFGTGRIDDTSIGALIERHFDLRPASIIAALDLRRPIYQQTASYGHFGRNEAGFPWESTHRAAALRAAAGAPVAAHA